MINKGDIITIITEKYIDYPGGAWRDHFSPCKLHLLVKDGETNNGNIKAVDSRGRLQHVHRSQVIAIKTR